MKRPVLSAATFGLLTFAVLHPATGSAADQIERLNLASGEAIEGQTIVQFSIGGVASSAAGAAVGDQILVGLNPTGALAGHEGELARLTKGGWVFQEASPGDQVFDAGADEQYVYTGDRSLFGGVWIDSKWRRLTPQAPKWKTGGSLGIDIALKSEDHGSWYFLSAQGGDFTVTLPSPFSADLQAMGMEMILEPFDGASGSAFIEAEGGGQIMTPDGDLVTRFEMPRGTGRHHVFRAVAGNLASGAAWYLVAGP